MSRITPFNKFWFPWLLLAPQLIITLVFFVWPSLQAIYQSFLIEDAFGFKTEFVWFENYLALFSNAEYLKSFYVTFLFSTGVTFLSMFSALILAAFTDRIIKGSSLYKTFLIWPYAVAPVVAGVLWFFMFHPTIGILAYALSGFGIDWNHFLNGSQALWLVMIAAAWKQVSYNYLFFLAGLQAIPKSLIEAAAIDRAGPVKRFIDITLPLLSPTTFFLLVVNVVYAFFDTFGIIHAITQGGPGGATRTLVYKVFSDGFIGLNLGSSAAQSVILLFIVGLLTFVQFRFVEKKVHY